MSRSPQPRPSSRLTPGAALLRAVRWHRRGLAVLLSCAAVAAALTALRPAPPPTREVVVAAQPIAAGRALTAQDLRLERVSPESVPVDAPTAPASLVGRVIVIDVPKGAALLAPMMLEPSRRTADGLTLVPLRVADPSVAALVRVGDVISVVATGNDGKPVVVATKVRIAALPRDAPASGPLGGGSQGQALIVVAAPAATATTIASWATNPTLSITIG